jgi:hypothetical protein
MQWMQHHLNNKNCGQPFFCMIAFDAGARKRQQMQNKSNQDQYQQVGIGKVEVDQDPKK